MYRGREVGEANKVVEWNGEVNGVSAKGGRTCWEVVGHKKSRLVEREARGGFQRAGIVGSWSTDCFFDNQKIAPPLSVKTYPQIE